MRDVRTAALWATMVLVLVGLALVSGCGGGEEVVAPLVPLATPLPGSGVSVFSGLDVDTDDAATHDALNVASHGTGDVAEFVDGTSTVFKIADGGEVTQVGGWSLDDGAVLVDKWTASTVTTDTTDHIVEVIGSSPVMTGGTNSFAAVNVDLAIGNSTGGTNSVYGVLVDGITGDAQNTETAIAIGNGWDRGIDLDGTALYMDNDQDSYFSELADDSIGFTPGAATGSLEVRTGNLQVGDGTPGETHNGEDFYVEGISEFDGTAYFDGAVDLDGVTNLVTDTEHIGLWTIEAATIASDTNGALWTIGDGEVWFIQAVYCKVTADFVCDGDDCTLQIGDGTDPNGLLDLIDGELQAADTEMSGAPAGWQWGGSTDTVGAYLAQGNGWVYAPSGSAETIDIDIEDTSGSTDPTAGAATCYLVYLRMQ